ncbi:MAG: hypothetical protein BZ138_07385 [Methanosphaera sp. rholeuAM270]|nr:MAG: hypothetical protein BZ138_07385 [Methanosphaera sp. rholeuAM270]
MNENLTQLTEALEKAIQTTADVPSSTQITYNDEVIMTTVPYNPLLTALENKGRTYDVTTPEVGFYKESPGNTASFIGETDNIPTYTKTTYTEVTDKMKVIATGIQISDMQKRSSSKINILEREIDRSYKQIVNKIDYTLLNGLGTAAAKDFKCIQDGIPAGNTDDLDGEPVTEADIDAVLDTVINGNGGNPDLLVTDSFVAAQLKQIAAPYRRYNDKVDIGLGFNVVTYESPTGYEIPVVVDSNMPVNTTDNEHSILFLDSSAIDIKYMMRPSFIDDLAKTNLVYNYAVASYVTAFNCAPFKCGLLEGIGDGE